MTSAEKLEIIRLITGVFDNQSSAIEARIQESLKNYIDAQRKGVLFRSDFCCDEFRRMAHLYWNPRNAQLTSNARKDTADMYADKRENGLMAISFRGDDFNYCPFCGEKL